MLLCFESALIYHANICQYILSYMLIHVQYAAFFACCSWICFTYIYIYIYIPGDDCLYASVYISARFGLSFYSPWSRMRNDGFSLQDQRTAILVPFCHTKVSSTPARPIAHRRGSRSAVDPRQTMWAVQKKPLIRYIPEWWWSTGILSL